MLKRISMMLLALLWTVSAVADPPASPGRTAFIEHGTATLKMIQDRFYSRQKKLYLEDIRIPTGRSNDAADAWALGVQLSALTAAARVDRKNLPDLRRFIDELDAYWVTQNRVGGYNSTVHARTPDRYYDDNAWLALGLVEAYELTHSSRDLERAKSTLAFVLSGEDNTLGGGLWWQENEKKSKNTCSNAPGICAALRVFSITKDPRLLATAKRLYAWTRANLQDKDGLYFDSIKLDQSIGTMKWTYNTALMIRAGCLLYDQDHDSAYLHEAERVATAAEAKWVRPATGVNGAANGGAIGGPAYFAHLLAEAMLELSARDHDPRWSQIDHAAVQFICDHNHDANGFFPEKWDETDPENLTKVRLINQASAARAMFRAAWPE